MFLTEYEALMG